MFWSINKPYPAGGIMQKFTPAFHIFKDTLFSFLSQFQIHAAGFCHVPDKRFWPMGVKTITDKCPWCFRIRIYQCFYSFYKVLLRTCGIYVRHFHAACCNIKKTDQACSAVTDVFKFHFCALSRLGQFVRIFMLQCLYASHFICWNNMASFLSGVLCITVYFTYFVYFQGKGFRIFCLFCGVEPVSDLMRV